jgi:hypothetical protein
VIIPVLDIYPNGSDWRGISAILSARSAIQQKLVVKPVAHLDIDLPRVIIVKPSEGETVVDQQMPIGDV